MDFKRIAALAAGLIAATVGQAFSAPHLDPSVLMRFSGEAVVPVIAIPGGSGSGSGTTSTYASTMLSKTSAAVKNLPDASGWAWPAQGTYAGFASSDTTSTTYFTQVNGYLKIRSGKKPSDAITDIFENNTVYGLDCASAVIAVVQYARLQTLGATDFNKLYPSNSFKIMGWTDRVSSGKFSTSFSTRRYSSAGAIKVYDARDGAWHANLSGENKPFSPSAGDKLKVGAVYYFERPGDKSTAEQGYNTIYMGKSGSKYKFFKSPGGIFTLTLDSANNYIVTDTGNEFTGTYLSANITQPNGSLLKSQDKTASD